MHSSQPLSTSVTTSQSHSTPWWHNSNKKNVTVSAHEWDRNRFEIYRSALELISISLCTRANTWMFDSVYIKGNQIKLFQKNVAYFIAAYITKWRFTVLTKNGGVIASDSSLECIILYNALCTMHAGGTMHCKACYYSELSPCLGPFKCQCSMVPKLSCYCTYRCHNCVWWC